MYSAVDLKASPPALKRGTPDGKPDITLTISDGDFVDLVSGKLNGQKVSQSKNMYSIYAMAGSFSLGVFRGTAEDTRECHAGPENGCSHKRPAQTLNVFFIGIRECTLSWFSPSAHA